MPAALDAILRARIETEGPLPFRDFMAEALYHPELGYYATGRAAIGRGGDFYTSVSVGPIFGKLLARQFAEMWERLGRPADFTIVEQGAHEGDFAADVLAALQNQAPECFEASRYAIVEPGAVLRERQAQKLERFASRVNWSASLAELAPWTGVHFSNELIDALPVHRVRWTGEEWLEQSVTWADERFAFVDSPLSSQDLREAVATLPTDLPPGYEIEVNLGAVRWVAEVSAKLERGWLLAIDYGYPRDEFLRPDRKGGTLAGYAQHRRIDEPLQNPGEIDLTSHVDWTGVAEAAERNGLRISGFTDQHHFMVGLSRLHFTDAIGALTPEQQKDLRGFKTLMHPNLMGLSFKVLALSKGVAETSPLAGFSVLRDARADLGLA